MYFIEVWLSDSLTQKLIDVKAKFIQNRYNLKILNVRSQAMLLLKKATIIFALKLKSLLKRMQNIYENCTVYQKVVIKRTTKKM